MDTSLVSAFANRETDQDFQGQLFTQIWEIFRTLNLWVRRGKKQINQEKMNLHVKLICLKRRKIGVPFRIRVHSNVFFILVTYLIWHWVKGNPFLKKQFSSYYGVFYHLMASVQSECRRPFIFYEQKTNHWARGTSEKWKHFASLERCPEWPLQMMVSRGSDWKLNMKLSKYQKHCSESQIGVIFKT